MSEQLNEFLSAAADGEAEAFELRRVLDEAKRDPALAATWERYHLIGQGIRREYPVMARPAAADAVWDACFSTVEQAPALALVGENPKARETIAAPERSWGGLAVAAGVCAVAVAAVLMVGRPGTEEPVPGLAQLSNQQGAITIDGPQLQVPAKVSAQDVQRANAYMLHHVQQRALNQSGVTSFLKVATFDAKE